MDEYCECLGYSDEADVPEFYRETLSTCRVPKACCACSEAVAKDTQKLTIVGVWEGHIFTYFYHVACYALLKEASNCYEMGALLGCSFNHCIEGWCNEAKATGNIALYRAVEAVIERTK